MPWKMMGASDPPSVVKMSGRTNGFEQFLAVVPPLEEGHAGGSPKRQFLVAFESQEEAVEEDEVPSMSMSMSEKKRRLTGEQVQFLERSFETEIKLEPERKALIAKELGLQPRQVAVWFQNRRARWKNKSLESDYHMLKAKYDAVVEENDKLKAEVSRLHSQLNQKTPSVDTPTEQQQQEPSAGDTREPIHNPSLHNSASPSISFSSSPKSEVDDPLDPSHPPPPPPSLISVVLPQALESLQQQQQQPSPSLPPLEDLFTNPYLLQHLSMSMKVESGLFSDDGLDLSGSHLLFTWDDNPTLSPWYDY